MNEYIIYTDSGCDISHDTLADWQIKCVNLIFRFDESPEEYRSGDMTAKEFYDRMRGGGCAKTAAANIDDFTKAFEPELERGNDIVYLAFSSALSTTCSAAQIASKELCERYPERQIYVVDTLCASAGQGLIVYLATKKRDSGATAEELAQYIEQTRLSLCHWFTVDDLVYLKRGGRVSVAAAVVGSVLGIKPVLHVDGEGRLINMLKVRGRRQALKAMAKKYLELAENPGEGTVFISQGDSAADAAALDDMLWETASVRAQLITDIGPVIGAHSGPGTLALFFIGRTR